MKSFFKKTVFILACSLFTSMQATTKEEHAQTLYSILEEAKSYNKLYLFNQHYQFYPLMHRINDLVRNEPNKEYQANIQWLGEYLILLDESKQPIDLQYVTAKTFSTWRLRSI